MIRAIIGERGAGKTSALRSFCNNFSKKYKIAVLIQYQHRLKSFIDELDNPALSFVTCRPMSLMETDFNYILIDNLSEFTDPWDFFDVIPHLGDMIFTDEPGKKYPEDIKKTIQFYGLPTIKSREENDGNSTDGVRLRREELDTIWRPTFQRHV